MQCTTYAHPLQDPLSLVRHLWAIVCAFERATSTTRNFSTRLSQRVTHNTTRQQTADMVKLTSLDSRYVAHLTTRDRRSLVSSISAAFKEDILSKSHFYQTLIGQTALDNGQGEYNDTTLMKLINEGWPLHQRRKIKGMFEAHVAIDNQIPKVRANPISIEEYAEVAPEEATKTTEHYKQIITIITVTTSTDSVTESQIPGDQTLKDLDELVPSVSEGNLTRQELDDITKERANELEKYIPVVCNMSQDHHRLSKKSALEELFRQLATINNQRESLVCFDLEWSERNRNLITEVGISIYDPAKQARNANPELTTIHLIVEENYDVRNRRFVVDHKDHFLFGNSIILPQDECRKFVQCIVNYYFCKRLQSPSATSGVLVGHNVKGDIGVLTKMGVAFPQNMRTLDTLTLFKSSHGKVKSALNYVLYGVGIHATYLHNGANDAHFTLKLLMALGDPKFREEKGLDHPHAAAAYVRKCDERKQLKNKLKEKPHLDTFEKQLTVKTWEQAIVLAFRK